MRLRQGPSRGEMAWRSDYHLPMNPLYAHCVAQTRYAEGLDNTKNRLTEQDAVR
jgi:hypothetical protein